MKKQMPLVACWEFVGTAPKKFEGEKRYISTGALDKDHVNEADVEMVTYENRPSRANLEVSSGDILFAKMASTEKTFVVDEVSAEDIYSTGFCAVRADETKILPKCLYYFLSGSLFLDQKDQNASGATQKAITNAGLAKITINLPALEDQRKFVAQMDLLCDVISSRRKQLAKLDELVKSRFVEMFGDQESNPYNLQVGKLSDVADIYLGLTHTPTYVEAGKPFLSVRDISSGVIDFSNCHYITEEEFDALPNGARPKAGDMLFCRVGTIGKPVIIAEGTPEFGTFVSLGYLRKKENINNQYLKAWMENDYFMRQVYNNVAGASQINLNTGWLKNFRILIPSIQMQNRFAAFVEQTEQSKSAIRQSLGELETMKKALMQKYFG